MSDIANLVKQIREDKAFANANLEAVPFQVRQGAELQKGLATARLEGEIAEYRQYVVTKGAAIIVVGSEAQTKEFADLASHVGGTFTLDAQELYRKLSQPAHASMGNTIFDALQVMHVFQTLKEIVSKLKNVEAVWPDFAPAMNKSLDTFEKVLAEVRDVVRAAYGDSLNARYLEFGATEMALDDGFTAPVVPFVVLNVSNEEVDGLANDLFGGRAIVVKLTDAALSENDITKAFNQLKNKLTKNG